MPAKPGQAKADAGAFQRKPQGKPAVGPRAKPRKLKSAPKSTAPSPEPLIHTYDCPIPEAAKFDEKAAQHAVDWIGQLHHYTGKQFAGKPFILMPWEARIIRHVFGWKRADGTRLTRKVYVEVPRKNGKTALAAAIGLYMAFADGEPGAQVFFAASDKDQASLGYGAARIMAEDAMERKVIPAAVFYNSTKRILIPDNPGAEVKCLSRDSMKAYGLNIHCLIFDELMTQKTREMWDALTTSQGAREQPLIFAITTSGWDRESVAYEHRQYTQEVMNGNHDDPEFLGVVYGAPDDADWTDPDVWRAATPSLGITVPLTYYEAKCAEAKQQPTAQNAFCTLYLCQWVGQETRLIPMVDWDASAGDPIHPEDFEGRTCFAGMDLSSTTDLSAFVLVFPEDEGVTVIPYVFIPEKNLRDRGLKDRAPYADWVRDGYLTATPGNAIDYAFIRSTILEAAETFDLRDISYDRWGATQLVQELQEAGLEVVPMGQGFASMSAPTKEFLRLVAAGKLHHGNHPVLKMMADRAAGQLDPAGNVKLAKAKSTGRIDGLVAAVMGLDGVMRRNAPRRQSVYAARGPDDFWGDDDEAEAL